MLSRKSLLLSHIFVFVLSTAYAAGQTPRAHITQDIDEFNTVTLKGNVHPVVASASSSQPVDDSTPMQHMILHLKGDTATESQLEQLIAQQNDPKSPLYHQYVAPKDFAAKFGAAPSDVAIVTSWLEQHGFTVEEVPAGGRSIIFSGTAGQVAGAFKTEIRSYTVNGVSHIANATDPQIPAALADAVGGIVKLHDFRHGHSLTNPKAVSAAELAHPQFTTGGSHYLAPADYGTIYDINPLYSAGVNGSGQTIAVLARSNISMSDVQSFRSSFGLKANNPVFVITNSNPGVQQGDNVETTLDTEWSGAVAPSATIKVIMSASTSTADGIDLSASYAVNNNVAPIITLSYGSCEAGMGNSELGFYNSLWKQAAAQGQTVFVSAGDSGAAGCDYGATAYYGQAINGLCSSPYATCVGGTEFVEGNNPGQYWLPGNNSTYGSAVSYIPESVWNESGTVSGGSDLWAGGGGASIVYPKPTWQTGPGVPADGKRDVPDISLTAAGHDGYLIWLQGGLNSVGGTSAAAPSFAGLMALVDQKLNGKQGVINPILYPLATKQASGGPAVFHDTKIGNNSVPGQVGFSATTGYDQASGLGSVDANMLVNNWTSGSTPAPSLTLTASATSVTVQQGKTGTATITSAATALNAAVNLTVTGAPTGLTATFSNATIASPGSGSATLNLAAGATVAPGTYPLTIKAVSGTVTATVTLSVVVPTPTFTVSPATIALTAMQGASAQAPIAITPQNGFSAAVNFSATNLPTGITAAFSATTISGTNGGSATATIAVAKTVNAGTYSFNITAIGGGITQTAAVTLTVTAPPSFTLTTGATTVNVTAGKTAQLSVSATPQTGFTSAIALSLSGLPTGVTGAFSLTPANNTLTFNAASTAKAGSYPLTITATGGGITKTATVTLVVSVQAACTLLANPTSISLNAGQSSSVALSCTVTQGAFTTPLAVTLTGAPTGMTAQVANTTIAPGSSSTLAIATTLATAAGKYNLALTATGSGFTQSLTIPVTVAVPATFTLSGSQSALTLGTGATGQMNVTVQQYGSFNSAVALSASGLPTGITAAFSKASLPAPGNGTAVLTLTATTTAKAGTYPITVTATGGGITQTISEQLIISAGPSFTLSLSAGTLTIPQGGTGAITTSTGNYNNGFNGQLVMSYNGLPYGVNYGVTGANASNNTVNITVTINVPSNIPVGTYPITVKDVGNSGSTATGNGVTETATFNLVVTAPAATKK